MEGGRGHVQQRPGVGLIGRAGLPTRKHRTQSLDVDEPRCGPRPPRRFKAVRTGRQELMERLPGGELAVVPERKLTAYLLASEHRRGGSKARFLLRFGFRREAWQQLEVALRRHAVEGAVTGQQQGIHGVTYVVEGPLRTPDGRDPSFRSVWIVEWGQKLPRLVTAFPPTSGGRP